MNITKELTVPKQQASRALREANALSIKNAEELNGGVSLLGKIKTVQKLIAGKKQAIIKPINEGLRQIRSLFAPIEENSSEAESVVKQKMLVYQKAVDDKAREEEKRIAARVDRGTMKVGTAMKKFNNIDKVDSTVQTDKSAVQFRTHIEVTIEDESKLPREYLVPNVTLINKDAKAGKQIPGVKVEKKKIVAGYTAATKDDIIERND